jgi:hypothetical protein
MIKVRCKIISESIFFDEIWPEKLACRPSIGDYISAKSGKILQIKKIVHSGAFFGKEDEPYLEIQL